MFHSYNKFLHSFTLFLQDFAKVLPHDAAFMVIVTQHHSTIVLPRGSRGEVFARKEIVAVQGHTVPGSRIFKGDCYRLVHHLLYLLLFLALSIITKRSRCWKEKEEIKYKLIRTTRNVQKVSKQLIAEQATTRSLVEQTTEAALPPLHVTGEYCLQSRLGTASRKVTFWPHDARN